LKLRHGIPSHDTFNRVFQALDPKQFLECFLAGRRVWRESDPQEVVALDGKALRRAMNKKPNPSIYRERNGPRATVWYWVN